MIRVCATLTSRHFLSANYACSEYMLLLASGLFPYVYTLIAGSYFLRSTVLTTVVPISHCNGECIAYAPLYLYNASAPMTLPTRHSN